MREARDEASYGVIPVREVSGVRHYLLVRHGAGHWGFPKGHAESGESALEAAFRELVEETALEADPWPGAPTFEEGYVYTDAGGARVRKGVRYFVGRVVGDVSQARPQAGEIAQLAWGDAEQTRQRLTFQEGRDLLDQVEGWFAGDHSSG